MSAPRTHDLDEGSLLNFLDPIVAGDPLFVDLAVVAVTDGLRKEVVEPVQEIWITLPDRPAKGLEGEGLIQKNQFAGSLLSVKDGTVGEVVNKGICFPVDHLKGGFRFGLETLIGSPGDVLFNGLLTGGAELGDYGVFLVVEVFIGGDLPRQIFVDEDGLANDDVWVGKVNLQVSLLGNRHTAHDDIELVGEEGTDDGVPPCRNQFQLNAHLLGHKLGHVHVKPDNLALLALHFEGHVSWLHTDTELSGLQDGLKGGFFSEAVIGRKDWKGQQAHGQDTYSDNCKTFHVSSFLIVQNKVPASRIGPSLNRISLRRGVRR